MQVVKIFPFGLRLFQGLRRNTIRSLYSLQLLCRAGMIAEVSCFGVCQIR